MILCGLLAGKCEHSKRRLILFQRHPFSKLNDLLGIEKGWFKPSLPPQCGRRANLIGKSFQCGAEGKRARVERDYFVGIVLGLHVVPLS